jgi:osmoprotectant transport system permease protein
VREEIIALTWEHVQLVSIALAAAILIAVPLGVLSAQKPRWRNVLLGFASVTQTIPSLALFGFLLPLPLVGGVGPRTAIVALILYALLPILRNTITGLLGVDNAVRESAVAMGMTPAQVLR